MQNILRSSRYVEGRRIKTDRKTTPEAK